ncbi:hypothetical protein DRW41_07050 [Neobacillus piezotolerans]|uniref:NERD domain-containing protein n=1 Tax=Neobacillus piezotolerans TaxID=2259171 RepID=A0A3D8GTN4_9BACI|nr:nuclease-related domain-containing protein [Neobacillus piezotolerans]RDU37591.1 hypothetical protein DRW41_07050 [Neobacillus piezotolerans]
MVVKVRTIPLRILKDEALLRNISPQCPDYSVIENDYYRRKAGYWGETQIDHYLRLLPKDGYYILNDLRIPFAGRYFQIDCLILTARYCLVIESKNIKGILFFDHVFDQLIRTNGDLQEAFEDPITQAKNILLQLKAILKELVPNLPFDFIVSIASSKTVLKSDSQPMKQVCHAYSLVQKILEMDKFYSREALNNFEIEEVCKLLLKLHSPDQPNIMKIYGLTDRDILKGIYCPKCAEKMALHNTKWICRKCDYHSKDAHVQKIKDYFLIYRPFITNKQLRFFLDIPSRRSAYRMLTSCQLRLTGNGKGRIYYAPPSFSPNEIAIAEEEQDEI